MHTNYRKVVSVATLIAGVALFVASCADAFGPFQNPYDPKVNGGIQPTTTILVSLTMVEVPAGTFSNGTANMTVSAFRISSHEITRAQFAAVMGADPSFTGVSDGTSTPVQNTNWYHAIAFCNKLSIIKGLTPVYDVFGVNFSTLAFANIPTGFSSTWNITVPDWTANGYRLPTEMEWLWAAMGAGGSYDQPFSGSTLSPDIDEFAWYQGTSPLKTRPVGTKAANALNLYDMSGNVSEWCWDWYGPYPAAQTDYRGGSSASGSRVSRGGSILSMSWGCALDERSDAFPHEDGYQFGFRVAQNKVSAVSSTSTTSTTNGGTTTTTVAQYSITYSANGATSGEAPAAQIKTHGANQTLRTNTGLLARTNYVFSGWNSAANGSGTTYMSGSTYSVNSSVVLYAKWNLIPSDYISSPYIGIMKGVASGTFLYTGGAFMTVSGFRMSATEITRYLFNYIMGSDPSDVAKSTDALSDPVQRANWYHAIAFCNKLSIEETLTPVYTVIGVDFLTLTYAQIPTDIDPTWDAATVNWSANGYRLPTEMEWLWAAIGTTGSSYYWPYSGYTASNTIGQFAWFSGNSGGTTHPIATKTANEWGIHDMTGNVLEWCWDWYASPANPGTQTNYWGPSTGTSRSIRGGSWNYSENASNVAERLGITPEDQNNQIGFRVVRN